jgi:hypothetical protein
MPQLHHSAIPARRFIARLATTFLASLAPIGAWAVCTCGFGDGLFTQTTITLDGNMGDWAVVHADTDNNVCDGPANGLVDRDAPVQSTGRDLTHFAFTWDQNNIYLFTERFGSASNTQSFVYYADIDNDGLMETGEPVIGVTWRGSNRQINVYTFTYVAQAAVATLCLMAAASVMAIRSPVHSPTCPRRATLIARAPGEPQAACKWSSSLPGPSLA